LTLKQKTDVEFYQNLGKLFYAIAATDKHVRDEEFSTLKHIINNEWISSENLEGDFIANTILNTFKWLHNDNEYNAKICYNSFINFKRSHEAFFSKKINSLILKTASSIAASFSSQNKSELIMLAKLYIEFKKNENEE
tara:strand:- start:26662 stop:27075 length:414 start_codon:yes stop_codon:yes gene_type:complete